MNFAGCSLFRVDRTMASHLISSPSGWRFFKERVQATLWVRMGEGTQIPSPIAGIPRRRVEVPEEISKARNESNRCFLKWEGVGSIQVSAENHGANLGTRQI